MKALKYVLYALGALIVLLIAVVAFVVLTFDPNSYKPQMISFVKEKYGRTLSIPGDIKLSIFPSIGVTLGEVTLSEPNSDAQFAALKSAQVKLALMPLLRKQVLVDEVIVDGARAALIKRKDGATNFDDLMGKAESKPEAPKPESAAGPRPEFDVSGIQIRNSSVSWLDESNNTDVSATIAELKTGRIRNATETDVSLAAQFDGRKPAAQGKLDLKGKLWFDLDKQQYRFNALQANSNVDGFGLKQGQIAIGGNVDADLQANTVKAQSLALSAKGSYGPDTFDVKVDSPGLAVNLAEMAIDGQKLKVTFVEKRTGIDVSGTLNADKLDANLKSQRIDAAALQLNAKGVVNNINISSLTLNAPKLAADANAKSATVDGLKLTVDGKVDADALNAKLDIPQLNVAGETASGSAINLDAKLAGAQRNATVNLAASGVTGSAKALQIGNIKLNLDAKQDQAAVKGTIVTPLNANLEAKVFDLPKLAVDLTITHPEIPQKTVRIPINGAVRADLGKEAVNADIVTQFDESNIKAKLGLAGFKTPSYAFDIAIDKLNLDRYMPPKPAGAPQSGGGGKAEPEKPIDLSALKKLNATGSLRIGQLTAQNVKASNVRIDIKAAGGRARIDPLSAALYQGTLNGNLAVDANANRFDIRQTLTGIAIGPLMRDAMQKDLLEGKGNVALDLTTSGQTVTAMKKALNGEAKMALKDGAIKGFDLAGSVRTLQTKLSGGGDEGEQSADKKAKTDFSELTGTFKITNGIARNNDLSAKSPFIRLGGEGEVDIPAGSLNYVAKVSVVGTMTGQGGKELTDVRGLTLPVRVYGPFEAMKYKIEFKDALKARAKQELEEQKQKLKEDLKEKRDELKDKLKDDLKNKLLGTPKGEGEPKDGSAPADDKKLEDKAKDKLKDKLKGLFR